MEIALDDIKIKNKEDEQKTKIIRREVQLASKELRAKYPVLQHQNAIGFAIFAISIAMIILSAVLYLQGVIGAVAVVISVAFWTSFLHELEHDLIHFMYFKKNKFMHDLMMLGVWVFRPMTINPWLRRILHFHHHRVSGTKTDLEERGLTNGEAWSLKRLLTMTDLLFGGVVRAHQIRKDVIEAVKNGELPKEQALQFKKVKVYGMLPFTLALYFIWYFFLLHHTVHFLAQLAGWQYQSPAFIEAQFSWINPLVIILILPNFLRMFCLHFITSNMHYYGDVEAGNVMQQTQVLNKWYFVPFQVFCFNFGSTHAIHHFVVNETFYVRQLTAARAHKVMREQGVRFNDLASFRRANRFFEQPPKMA
ncbi:MAG TPA: fatty acid desaturase [Chitinophagales bacterium]|mgnify:CR=1 FL=1|nr:fatty acid desaturase [Chitinophagales bacterium]